MSVFSKVYEDMMAEIQNHEMQRTYNTEFFIRSLYTESIISSFEYPVVPDFIKTTPDYIEECFFGSPIVAFFEENGEYLIAPAYPSGVLMQSGLYSTYTMIMRNGKTYIRDYKDVVLGFDNSLHLPSRVFCDPMVESSVRALRAVDSALLKATAPVIFAMNDEQKVSSLIASVENAYKSSNPFHFINVDWVESELQRNVLFDNREVDIISLWDTFVRYKNLFYTTNGLNNVEISKSERLTRAEGESNTEITRYSVFYDRYKHRLDWFKRILERFGYSMTVIVNRNVETVHEFSMTPEDKVEFATRIVSPYSEEFEKEEVEDEDDKADK